MILFTKPKTLFSFVLHISDLSPVMIITYTQKPRVTVLLSSKSKPVLIVSSAILEVNNGHRPLLVNEGGALTLCLTVVSFFYCDFMLKGSCKVLMSTLCLSNTSQAPVFIKK